MTQRKTSLPSLVKTEPLIFSDDGSSNNFPAGPKPV